MRLSHKAISLTRLNGKGYQMSKEPDQLTRILTIVDSHTDMLNNLTTAIQGDGDAPGIKGKQLVLIAASKIHTKSLFILGGLILGLAGYIIRATFK